jgi:hypothetical protein
VEKLPGVVKSLIENHEDAALVSMIMTLVAGATALGSLFYFRNERLFRIGSIATLIISIAATAALGYTANLGGQVRHTEIRASPAASGVGVQSE